MKVAIIGAGLAGLSVAHFLLESPGIEVTIFDAVGIGGGASSVCSGLLHPYPGLAARRSHRSDEALLIAKELLRISSENTPKRVASQMGIVRRALTLEQNTMLSSAAAKYNDVEPIDDEHFLIHSGITVHTENYLEGLWNHLAKKGAQLVVEHIGSLESLASFDHIVIAAGYGITTFAECSHLNVKFLKGQALQIKGKPNWDRSYISKGYIAHLGHSDFFELGSTYEREFASISPDIEVAKEQLAHKLSIAGGVIVGCKAGVRVCNRSHYLPLVEKVAENVHVFTALGSRGLLYHGLFGRGLAFDIKMV